MIIQRIVCENCKKESKSDFGKAKGWIEIKPGQQEQPQQCSPPIYTTNQFQIIVSVGGTPPRCGSYQQSLHFCSGKCLTEWITKETKTNKNIK